MESRKARTIVKAWMACGGMVLALAACSPREHGLEIEAGSDVALEKKDGVKVAGRLVEVKPEHVTVESRDGSRTSIKRSDIAALRAKPGPPEAVSPPSATASAPSGKSEPPPADPKPAYREVTLPAGTVLSADLQTAVASDSSKLEDRVRATLRKPVTVAGVQALPAGTALIGHVTAAERSARVKGRAFVSFRFTALDPAGDPERVSIRTEPITRFAPATKKRDAAKIGGGAVGGAIVGGILGGGDGAAKGAAIGGAAGTGVVLSTRGREIRLGPGTDVTVRLASPVTLRVPER